MATLALMLTGVGPRTQPLPATIHAFAGQNMQNPPGHRLSIHNAAYREVGIGVVNGSNGSVGPQLVTQNFGTGGSRVITGVVYLDSNNNSFYDPGEGISGVRVETPGSAFFSITSTSGGYALPVDTDATHAVTFSQGSVPVLEHECCGCRRQ